MFLIQKRQFLLALLENPNLLEHERFTDLLWATFHLTEELEVRESLSGLPEADIKHVAVDIQRVYCHLIVEWLFYVEHLKANYPFPLFTRFKNTPLSGSPLPRNYSMNLRAMLKLIDSHAHLEEIENLESRLETLLEELKSSSPA
jgi:hypothetical protein